jgi:hypothetical protein
MNIALKYYIQLIADLETSGNGDGQQKEGEPDFGHVSETTRMDNDRWNFLHGNKQHFLYFWHVMDTCDLLLNTLKVLPNEFTASSDGVPKTQECAGDTPTVTNNNEHAREEQQAYDNNFKQLVSECFGHLALVEGYLALGSALEKKVEVYVYCLILSSSCYFVLYLSMQPETLDQPHVRGGRLQTMQKLVFTICK